MTADSGDGLVDPADYVHGHDNLFIGDCSVHVTNGGVGPA
jgi:choline dehydrogenase-like flavoprotein